MKLRRIQLEVTKFEITGIVRQGALVIALSLALAVSAVGGPIVDRVVANVNGHVVLQSDWEQEVAFEALSNGRDPDSLTADERKAALDRLIDQELLREQVRPSQPAPADQVAVRVAEVRKLNPEGATDERWHAMLQRYGLTQSDLEKRLGDEIRLMKLVEDRLRPSIQVDQQAVEAYYHDELLPDMKKAGSRAAPLTDVFGRIKDLLTEKKMNELLSGWLASLRSGSQIKSPEPGNGRQNR
jgi:transcriptional regulator with XRE-family HTH domain